MFNRLQPSTLAWLLVLTAALCACQTETIEVTRIVERRVIEHVVVTVEVTRIHRIVETPEPLLEDLIPPTAEPDSKTPLSSPTATASPAPPPPPSPATATPRYSSKEVGERLLATLQEMEQTLLTLVQDLNSDPLPISDIIALYDTLRGAPTFDVPADEAELLSIYVRYREQVDYVSAKATDLYTHLITIQAGEADQTTVSPIHLSLAQDAASTGTSTIQGLMRELESYLASRP